MNRISYKRELPVIGEYDVAVLGGGPAGVCAAIEAARTGQKTVLIEASGMLGGMATTALVGPFMTCYDRDGDRQVVHGIFDEIVERTASENGAVYPSETDAPSIYSSFIKRYHKHVTPFDSFALQLALDDLTREAGVELFFYTKFVDCEVSENGSIVSVVLDAPQGLVAMKAKEYIDCTGNADVAFSAGVPTWNGGEDGSAPQPATLFFEIDGVDDEVYAARNARPPRPVKAYKMPEKGRYKVNHERVYFVNANDARSMTDAHIAARRQVLKSFETLRSLPGFEKAELTQVAPVLGVRESRHIVGEYRITVKDVCEGTRFDDSICVFGYGMDVHSRDGKVSGGFHGESANMYEIPYRCLVPKGCPNLLVAGKTISAESQAAGSLRVMPACMATGQAAGAAAAIAASRGIAVGEVPVGELKSNLKAHGAVTDIDE